MGAQSTATIPSPSRDANTPIRFAPLVVPWERRKQTIAVLSVYALAIGSVLCLLTCLFIPMAWPLVFVYYLWILFFDHTPSNGGNQLNLVKGWSFWDNYARYFPAQLHKTSELNPKEQYVFAVHPHGIVSAGIWANILLQGSGAFQRLFPALKLRAATLPINFKIPIWREFVLSLGLIESSRESISAALGSGSSVLIVPGGAKEALYAKPDDDYYLTLKSRKGFVRLAMMHGCSLVPVFSFGENEIYGQAGSSPGSYIRRLQDYLYSKVGIAFPLLRGRGIFNYDFGLLPFRSPIHTVVGAPIRIAKNPNPTAEDINRVHESYIEALGELFEKHRAAYGDAHRNLVII